MSNFPPHSYNDPGFGRAVRWDVPLLEEYESQALPVLAENIPDVVYVICGDGPDRQRQEEQKSEYYCLAVAYEMPSRDEGFRIIFLNAMACGIPVMGSRLDGSREALLDGELGVLVNPDDASEVVAGIVSTLSRATGVPERLDYFAFGQYQERVAAIARELVGAKP